MAIYGDDDMVFPIDDKNQEVYIAISSLKNQQFNEVDDSEDFLKKYTLGREDRPQKEISAYYCAVCGLLALLANARLEKLPTRTTDHAIILDKKKFFVKHYLIPAPMPIAIKREQGTDIIIEHVCQCQAPVAYTSLNNLPNVRDAALNLNIKGIGEAEQVLFVISDSLVMDAKNALVFAELADSRVDSERAH